MLNADCFIHILQRGPQFLSAAEQRVLRRFFCRIQNLANGAQLQSLIMLHLEHHALARCQLGQGFGNARSQLTPHQVALGTCARSHVGNLIQHVVGATVGVGRDARIFLAHLPLAQQIEAQIGHDAINPGVERALEAEIADVPVGLQEGFLINVLRVLLRARQVIGQAKHGAIVLAHQFLERGVIATLCFSDQLRIVHSALGLPHQTPPIGGIRGRFVRLPPRLRRTEPRANREGNCNRFGRHAGFYLVSNLQANSCACNYIDERG